MIVTKGLNPDGTKPDVAIPITRVQRAQERLMHYMLKLEAIGSDQKLLEAKRRQARAR